MMQKKIFFIYLYRSLWLLYRHLYRIKANYVYYDLKVDEENRECSFIDVMPTIQGNVLAHYKAIKSIEKRYNPKCKLDSSLDKCIVKLLQNQLPTKEEAISANLLRLEVDQYTILPNIIN